MKKRSLISALAILLPISWLAAADVPFTDEFDDNRNKWDAVEESATWIGQIEKGRLVCENLSPTKNTMRSTMRWLDISWTRPVEIAMRLRFEEGPEQSGATLFIPVLNLDSQSCRRYLQIAANGVFEIYDFANGKYTTHRKWTKFPQLKEKQDHEVMIRVVGGTSYYLIDGVVVDMLDVARIEAGQFGFSVDSGTTISLDHFHVRYLEENPAQLAALVKKMDADAQAYIIGQGPALEEFVETFDDNHREWPFLRDADTWTAKIEGGELLWTNKKTENSKQRAGIKVPINDAADYDLRFRLRRAAGATDVLIGLNWGRSEANVSSMEFGFASNGYYLLGRYENDSYKDITDWRKTTLIKSDQPNELRVRKLGRTLYAFVNGQVVADVSAVPLAGDQVTIAVSQNVTAAFDEIRVQYPKLTPEQTEQERAELVAALKKAHAQKGLGAVYSGTARQEQISRDNAQQLAAMGPAEAQLSKKDDKALDKVRRDWTAKSMLSLLGSWKRPKKESGGETLRHFYYFYKVIEGVQFYYQFEIRYVGPLTAGKPLANENFAVTNVNIIGEHSMRRIYGVQ